MAEQKAEQHFIVLRGNLHKETFGLLIQEQ